MELPHQTASSSNRVFLIYGVILLQTLRIESDRHPVFEK